MQITEGVLRHQRAAIKPHPANNFGGPDRIAGKERIKFRRAQETHHADLHDEMVDQFLRLLLCQKARVEIALNVDIKERGGSSQRHCTAILRFYRRQISEVEPLYRFLRVPRRAGDIVAVFRRHLLHLQQRATMLRQLLTQANRRLKILSLLQIRLQVGELQLAFAHQITDAIQRDAAIIANNAPATITIRQTG
ncbi:Uncharacterised protein [Salmonella enterica subsp. enterica serovar Typhimurium str. DT104]|nr:Uncharacterised protein [Salmonella enterica subsp. enterica serovar Typhimurium str. DT104]